jgi:hypothetical protein
MLAPSLPMVVTQSSRLQLLHLNRPLLLDTPLGASSETSDVAPNASTAGDAVAPIVTSTSGRVLRRPNLYKDSRR